MKVSNVMVRNVVTADEHEHVSKVLAKMSASSIHQIPVTLDGLFSGMVNLKDMLPASYEPHKTEIKKFKVGVTPLHPNDDVEDAVKRILESGYKALPVVVNYDVKGMLSMTDLIKHVEYSKGASAEHFLTDVVTVKDTDSLDKALTLMSEHNVSRLPVLDADGKVSGSFDSLRTINFLNVPHESVKLSYLTAVEKKSLANLKVKDYMRDTKTVEVNKFSFSRIINLLQSNEEVVLTENGHPVGIVTPKDLLGFVVENVTQPIRVSHYEKIEPMLYGRFEDMLVNFNEKFSRMIPIQNFFVDVDNVRTSKKINDRERYVLRTRLITPNRTFHSHSEGWDLLDATRSLLDKLEKQLVKSHERNVKLPRVKKRLVKEEEIV